MRPYFPGGVLNALASAPQGSIPATPSTHRLRRGLPGYLILFAPHAFAPQRQCPSRWSPSPRMFLPISTNFTSTLGIPPPSPAFKLGSIGCTSGLSPGLSHLTYQAAYARFTPNKSEQRLHPLYYRGCWHRVSRCFLCRYRHYDWLLTNQSLVPADRALRSEDLHHSRGVAASGFPPLRKIPTAASRRSLDRVSVPVWLIILSDQLPVLVLVGHYPANKLMGRGLILWRKVSEESPCFSHKTAVSW